MTEAPTPHQTPRPTAGSAVVLRKVPYTLLALAISVIGFTDFLTSSPHGLFHAGLPFAVGAGMLIGAAIGATYQAEVRDGTLTFRGEWRRSRSVDLLQLVRVSAPDQMQNALAAVRPLILSDATGNEVKVSFYLTSPMARRRLLAALEPYVQGAAVSRSGLIDEALAGELWWPWPRRATPSGEAA
jgi:hypothetical protein